MTALYKNPVHRATNFLDGQRTRNLQTVADMTIPAKLKAIRESLPEKLTVREISAAMGKPDVPNTYGYYESAQFTRKTLPLDKAQMIATIFARHGGDPRAVLRLTGLSEADVDAEASAIGLDQPRTITISLPVTLPSEERLTAMMAGMLDSVGLPNLADDYAGQLAQLLPTALAGAAAPDGLRRSARERQPSAPAQDPAKAGPDKRQ